MPITIEPTIQPSTAMIAPAKTSCFGDLKGQCNHVTPAYEANQPMKNMASTWARPCKVPAIHRYHFEWVSVNKRKPPHTSKIQNTAVGFPIDVPITRFSANDHCPIPSLPMFAITDQHVSV